MAPFDVDAALSWCDAHCEGPFGADLRGMVARGWVLSDPPAALRWLSSSSESQEARFALRVTYSNWIRADREAAMQWIAEQALDEPPPALIPTYPIYARVLARESPGRAIRFAELIPEKDVSIMTLALSVARFVRDTRIERTNPRRVPGSLRSKLGVDMRLHAGVPQQPRMSYRAASGSS